MIERGVDHCATVDMKTRTIAYGRELRAGGHSTWDPMRLAVEGIGPFSMKPLRWAAVVGIASTVGAGLFGLWLATHALLLGEAVQASPGAASRLVDGMLRLDERLFLLLNALGSERWDGMWLFITNKSSWIPFYVALMYLGYRHYGLRDVLIIVGLVVVVITITDQLANLFKQGFERLRPCREEHLREIIRYIAPRCGRYGYFSAHAANSMALAAFLGLLLGRTCKRLVLLLLVFASIVSFSRIYVGVHYPLDILTGMVIGVLAAFLFYGLSRWFKLSRSP